MVYLRPGFIVVIVGVTLTAVSTFVVGFRYFCRWYRMGQVSAADHLIFIALTLTWGNTVINYYQDESSRRFRPSQFRNPEKRPKLEIALRGTLITWYIYRMTYGVALCFVKLSILFFYRTIATNRTFRRLVNGTILFVVLYTISTTFASAFQCTNPAASYDTSAYLAQFGVKTGKKALANVKCFDPSKLWIFTGAVNLFTDVLIMGMPIPTLLSLRVPMSKRLALIGIFSVGIMAIVASCVRMWVMALWAESPQNSAKFGTDLLLWGQVETNAGIVSASVPFLRLACRGRDRGSESNSGRGKFGRKEVKEIIESPVRSPAQGDAKESPKGWPSKGIRREVEIHTEVSFDGDEKGLRENPAWGDFITVPEDLSGRDSKGTGGLGQPAKVHMTV